MPPTSRRKTSPNTRARTHFFLFGLLRLHDGSLRNPRYLLRCHLPTRGPVMGPQGQSAGPCVRARVHSRAPIGARLRCRGPGRPKAVLATASCTASDKAPHQRRAHGGRCCACLWLFVRPTRKSRHLHVCLRKPLGSTMQGLWYRGPTCRRYERSQPERHRLRQLLGSQINTFVQRQVGISRGKHLTSSTG